jgi:hypothetical protein
VVIGVGKPLSVPPCHCGYNKYKALKCSTPDGVVIVTAGIFSYRQVTPPGCDGMFRIIQTFHPFGLGDVA